MSESMIERVARALWESLPDPSQPPPPSWVKMTDAQKSLSMEQARAAIEAMREPTKTQLESMEPWSRVTGHHEMVWKAGIDAALKWPAGSADRAGVPMARD